MFLGQDAQWKYEITNHRKQNLLRMRKYMTETLIDQIPALGQF